MRKLKINVPIFDQLIIVIQAENMKSIDDYIQDTYNVNFGELNPENRSGTTYNLPDTTIIIGILPYVTTKILVHETGHATFDLMRFVGINPQTDQETFCYIQEYIFDKIAT